MKKSLLVFIIAGVILVTVMSLLVYKIVTESSLGSQSKSEDNTTIPISFLIESYPTSYSSVLTEDNKRSNFLLKLPDLGSGRHDFVRISTLLPENTTTSIDEDTLKIRGNDYSLRVRTSLGENAGIFEGTPEYKEISKGIYKVNHIYGQYLDLTNEELLEYSNVYFYTKEFEAANCLESNSYCGSKELNISGQNFSVICRSNNNDPIECDNIIRELKILE